MFCSLATLSSLIYVSRSTNRTCWCGGSRRVVRTRERVAYTATRPEHVLLRVRRCVRCGDELVSAERGLSNLNLPLWWSESEAALRA
jgi:hypothetical protein